MSTAASPSPADSPGGRRRNVLPLLLAFPPVLYLLVALASQPSDRLGPPEVPPLLARLLSNDPAAPPPRGRLLYDDYDSTAMALRALNASRGRVPGRTDPPPDLYDRAFRQALDTPAPLEPRYFLEWPHAALLFFHVGLLPGDPGGGAPVPAAVLDGDYHNVVRHEPRNEQERQLWRKFRAAIQVYAVLMIVCHLGLLAVLSRGYGPGSEASGALVLLVLPAALYFTLNRFDMLPALLTALSFLCLGRRAAFLSGLCLGVAAALKVYPVLLAPLVVRYLLDDRRGAARWTAAFLLAVLPFFLVPLLRFDAAAVWGPYAYQMSRSLEGWTGYAYVFPEALADSRWFRTGSLGAAVLAVTVTRPAGLASLFRRGLLVLIVFVATAVFYSPQWIVWLLPMLVPLAGRSKVLFGLAVLLDLVTYTTFPVVFDLGADLPMPSVAPVLIVARYAILAGLVGVLGWHEFRALGVFRARLSSTPAP